MHTSTTDFGNVWIPQMIKINQKSYSLNMEIGEKFNTPLVSIIVNCYNGRAFLNECIQSVINQDYQNWEIIFWDNNSEDDSVMIAQSFDEDRIKIHKSSKHTLLYEARNAALKCVNGDLVCFLDVDDYWHVNKLTRQVSLHNKGIMASFSSYLLIDENGNEMKAQPEFKGHFVAIKDLLRNNIISLGTVCLNRSIVESNLFREDLNLIGDFELWLRISAEHEFAYIDERLEFSRQHSSNTSKIHAKSWIHERRKLYSLVLKSSWKASTVQGVIYIIKSEISAIIN